VIRSVLLAALAATLGVLSFGCGPRPGAPNAGPNGGHAVHALSESGVTLSLVERDGDPATGLSLAVATAGVGDDAVVGAAALAGVTEARLRARGVTDAVATVGSEGYRVRATASSPEAARAFVVAAFAALTAPLSDADLVAAQSKVHALAQLPLVSATEEPIARCLGAPRVLLRVKDPALGTLEGLRARSHVRTRVAIGVVGARAHTLAVSSALSGMSPLGPGDPLQDGPKETFAPFAAFEAESHVRENHATIGRQFGSALEALAAAERLESSPLAARIAALDSGVAVRGIAATARVSGGCLTIDLAFPDLAREQTVAAGITIAEEEIELVVGSGFAANPEDRAVRRLPDAGMAAEAAAWLSLSREARDAGATFTRVALATSRGPRLSPEELEAALGRAQSARKSPAVVVRGKVEHGQGELWLFLGSPCGTMLESNSDAGLTAAALAALRPDAAPGISIDPVATPDAVGFLVHGAPLPGESPTLHARRLADVAARPLLGEPVSRDRAERALRGAYAAADVDETRALGQLAAEVTPGHLSWLLPVGSPDALGRASDVALASKVLALRTGPVRMAVLANDSEEQTKAAAHAADRWLPSRAENRTCEPIAPAESEHPGTYAATRLSSGPSEVFLSVQVPDQQSYGYAEAWVSLLSGPDGLLAKALGAGLARESSIRLLGAPRAAAVVIRIVTADGALDAAVAQTRALFARFAQGALTNEQATWAFAHRKEERLLHARDPRTRVLELFREPVSEPAENAEALRSLGTRMWADSRLVIVALRSKRER
jgi:hypothetical protein